MIITMCILVLAFMALCSGILCMIIVPETIPLILIGLAPIIWGIVRLITTLQIEIKENRK